MGVSAACSLVDIFAAGLMTMTDATLRVHDASGNGDVVKSCLLSNEARRVVWESGRGWSQASTDWLSHVFSLHHLITTPRYRVSRPKTRV